MSLQDAIRAHVDWLVALSDAFDQRDQVFPEEVAQDGRCPLGKWIHGVEGSLATDPAFAKLKDLHSRFHVCAAEAAVLAADGRVAEALNQLDDPKACGNLSEQLLVAFGDLERRVEEMGLPDDTLIVPEADRVWSGDGREKVRQKSP